MQHLSNSPLPDSRIVIYKKGHEISGNYYIVEISKFKSYFFVDANDMSSWTSVTLKIPKLNFNALCSNSFNAKATGEIKSDHQSKSHSSSSMNDIENLISRLRVNKGRLLLK